ncbi:hypothetical protein [Symbiobacterium thermophilum]|uniref:hypothetical protein n=1 Tax=Symbiobacterium thermophilum TaxID=2734 RepID=UPI0023575B28|nr:hypothetical protein [Symbiobacterium thermophilum]
MSRQAMHEPRMRVLSLGAGVQSTTLILMAARGEFDSRPDVAIFADTGWEPKRVYEHLAWLEREVGGVIPILRVSAGNIREDSLRSKDGKHRFAALPFFVKSPTGAAEGRLRRQCTREYKIEPITRKIRELLGLQPGERMTGRVEQWFGISADEIYRVKDNRYPWIDNRYPLIERGMTRQDCLDWLSAHGYPTPPRSSCIGCPYHDDAYWLDMRENHPEEWADACDYDEQIRTGLKGVLQEAYLHRMLIPLRDVPLTPEEKHEYRKRLLDDAGQLHLWDALETMESSFDEECEGMCGV